MEGTWKHRMHLTHTYVLHRLKQKNQPNKTPAKPIKHKQCKKPFSVGKLCSWSFRTKGKKKIKEKYFSLLYRGR